MIDVDETLRDELHRLVAIDPRRDWGEVLARAGERPGSVGRRRLLAALAAVLAAAILAVVTPLGPAIAQGLGDFSAWLTGQPGAPVSEEEQREFEAKNARSWLGFPKATQLRRLITEKAGSATVDLLGFRSGASALCLRLTVTGEARTSTLSCAPLAELRREGGPARVVLADHTVGKGDKVAWYGIDRVHSADLQITAGIVTDGVDGVVIEDDAGRHEVPAASNAFLYVAEQPEVGQRVKRSGPALRRGSRRCRSCPCRSPSPAAARNAPPHLLHPRSSGTSREAGSAGWRIASRAVSRWRCCPRGCRASCSGASAALPDAGGRGKRRMSCSAACWRPTRTSRSASL
jgi:hypothetical protein